MGKIDLSGFKLNLREFFIKEAAILVKSYKSLMSQGRGVKMDAAPSNAASTIKSKGKNLWLVNTGETKNRGFESDATENSMTVEASGKRHSGNYLYKGKKKRHTGANPTYEELFEFHNQKNYSGIFGDKLPVGSQLPKRLEKEVKKQIDEFLKAKIPPEIHL